MLLRARELHQSGSTTSGIAESLQPLGYFSVSVLYYEYIVSSVTQDNPNPCAVVRPPLPKKMIWKHYALLQPLRSSTNFPSLSVASKLLQAGWAVGRHQTLVYNVRSLDD